MQLLKSIILENFRVFRTPHKIELKPLTVLIGPNSSGKSSVIKSLILCSNNSSNKLQNLDFTGPKHNLGTFHNATNINSNEPFITIGFEFNLIREINRRDRFLMRETTLQRYDGSTSRGNYKRLGAFFSKLPESKSLSTIVKVFFKYVPNEGSGDLLKLEYFTEYGESPFLKFILNDGDSANHNLVIDFDQIKKDEVINQLFYQPFDDTLNRNFTIPGKEEEKKKSKHSLDKLNGIQVYRVSTEDYNIDIQKKPLDICKDLFIEVLRF
jgi:hypothetical protein